MKLLEDYFQNSDVLWLGRDLIGKILMTRIDGYLTGGIIVETESYAGVEDKASHSYGGRRTKRNEVMYSSGGKAYVYRCYGIHALFNIVTNRAEIPHAILIRGIKPLEGIEVMLKRRKKAMIEKRFAIGPGNLTQALGIDTVHNGLSLQSDLIWLEDRQLLLPADKIAATKRIGIDYAAEYALKPWRFVIDEESL